MKSRLGGFADRSSANANSLWTLDTTGSGSNYDNSYDDNDWSGTIVIGTSTDLEKRYLRLTTVRDRIFTAVFFTSELFVNFAILQT